MKIINTLIIKQGCLFMVNAFDVAEYILYKCHSMTAMKLQKIVYYSQAWHLAWTENPLFLERIEAWRDGPVIVALFECHKGQFKLEDGFFSKKSKAVINNLSDDQKDIIDRVINYYGDKDPHWLSQLTHLEEPWKKARERSGIQMGENCSEEITHQSMSDYYSSI